MGLLDRVGRFIDDVLLLPDEVRESLQAGDHALENELYEEAESIFRDVLAERPQLARAAIGLAHARDGLGDREGTLEALREARQLLPEDGDLAVWTARLALDVGQHELAAAAAHDASRARAEQGGAPLAEACALAAWAEWRRGRPDRAARELRKALSADSSRSDLQVALVEALADARDWGGARATAARLDASDLDAALAARVGRALLRAGSHLDARPFLEVAAATGEPSAQIALARDALSRGSLDEAERLARETVAKGVGAEALTVLAEVLVVREQFGEAAQAYAAAASMSASVDLFRQAARIAPRDEAETYAQALEDASENDPVAAALRAWATGTSIDGDEPRACLARARVALNQGDPKSALDALDAFDRSGTRVDRDEGRMLRRDALRAQWTVEGELDLATAIVAVERFASEHGIEDVARRARALREELDRPLLLAVLGEFNAGKSTLINAFIGSDVAPMGIVPTTATLNVLRSGAQKLVRVIKRNGSTREGSHDQLKSILKDIEALGIDAKGGESVDRVEIILPSETLEKVWILDAPGTNALDAEHERLAKEAARRADAVLWVFDAAQAGKLTETVIHEALRAQGRRVVPVLNKVDRLREGELDEVEKVVREGFGESPRNISAKAALKARLAEDQDAYVASGFPALLQSLEETVFSKSRTLKHAACAGRLAAELDAALATESEERESRKQRHDSMVARTETLLGARADAALAVDDALRTLESDLDSAFESAADEVLNFVRPRAHQFASHGVHPEDRAFLAQLLERRLRSSLEACERRMIARLRALLAAPQASSDALADLDLEIRSRTRPALAAFWGFQRGVLAGGALSHFFESVLPRANLDRAELASALAAARVSPRDELRPALQEAIGDLVQALVGEVETAMRTLDQEADRVANTVFGPMRTLREVLGEAGGLPNLDR